MTVPNVHSETTPALTEHRPRKEMDGCGYLHGVAGVTVQCERFVRTGRYEAF